MDTPTIYDVSRLSGVSTATVSRTFTTPDRVRNPPAAGFTPRRRRCTTNPAPLPGPWPGSRPTRSRF